jgi:uncharacterized protein (DUF3820 family)
MRITFGKHRDEDITDVPTSYLAWLEEQEWLHGKFPELAKEVQHELRRRQGDVSSLGRVKSADELRVPEGYDDDLE